MKFVIAGGSGQLGQILARRYESCGAEVVVLCRGGRSPAGRSVVWDGKHEGPWCSEVDGADVVVNLAGRTVNCRYTEANLKAMMDSRVDSTRAIGRAIAAAPSPPATWLQMSTATIYSHRFDAANDEATGIIGGNEPDAPAYWKRSIDIARAWESELDAADTTRTRRVALRSAMVMSPDRGGVFDVMLGLVRRGLGGAAGSGRQFVSWIHDEDFVRALDFLIEHPELEGAVNLAAPHPLPHREFMAAIRQASGVRIGLPASQWMLEIGAFFLQTDTELLLKSRRVVPGRLLDAGFRFHHPEWSGAAKNLLERWQGGSTPG